VRMELAQVCELLKTKRSQKDGGPVGKKPRRGVVNQADTRREELTG